MKTPIYDFVNGYILKDPVRMHMPGHKGRSPLIGKKEFSDIYKYDITEIDGADYLSAPCGIIAESEANRYVLFHGRILTVYKGHAFYDREKS